MIDESRGPALLIAAYFLIVAAGTFSNPPGAPTDEAAHYIRAAAISTGDFLPEERPTGFPGGQSTISVKWMLKQSRLVSLPTSLSPENFRCRGIPGRIAPCEERAPKTRTVEELTYVGTYPPTPYLVPAALMRGATGSEQAVYLARAGSAFVCWLLLALAIAVAWDKRSGWVSVMGVAAAITPMVIYMSASLSGSGLETAAAICFLASLLRMTRSPVGDGQPKNEASGGLPAWVWAAAGLSGALLTSSRDLGLLWLGLHLVIFLGWAGLRPAWAIFRSGGRIAVFAAAAVAALVALSVAWQIAIQVRPAFALRDWLAQMRPSVEFFSSALQQQVGVFGPLDTELPAVAYAGWLGLTLLVFALGLFAGDGRRRILAVGAVLATAGFTVALDAVQRTVGFGVQGRYLLPLAVAIPMVAGEMLTQNTDKLRRLIRRGAGPAVAVLVSGVLFLGWYTIGRRYSVGPGGSRFFFRDPVWSPPLGWAIWGSAATAGALLILAAGLISPGRLSRSTK